MCDYHVEIFTDKDVTAKKDHVCNECVGVIQAGSKYNYMAGTGDDGFFTNKAHLECRDLARKIDIDGEGCFAIGNLRYEISNESATEEQRYEYWWITKKYPTKSELRKMAR